MMSIRIVDPDMGAVAKVPLTGIGTIHGVTFKIDSTELPEFSVGIVELCQPDMAMSKFEDHVYDNLEDADAKVKQAFMEEYKEFTKYMRKKIIPG